MNAVVVASSERDAAAVEAVKQHHAEMAGSSPPSQAGSRRRPPTQPPSRRVPSWCAGPRGPGSARPRRGTVHVPAGAPDSRARLLVEAMLAEHELIVGLVERLRSAPGRLEAAGEARALSVTFESHLAKENDQILPLPLAESPGVSRPMLRGNARAAGRPRPRGPARPRPRPHARTRHTHAHDHTRAPDRPHADDQAEPASRPTRPSRAMPRPGAGARAPAARATVPTCPSSTPGRCRTPSGTPPSSAPWMR